MALLLQALVFHGFASQVVFSRPRSSPGCWRKSTASTGSALVPKAKPRVTSAEHRADKRDGKHQPCNVTLPKAGITTARLKLSSFLEERPQTSSPACWTRGEMLPPSETCY